MTQEAITANAKNDPAPRVFISYSWSSSDHATHILEIAERLVNDGVDVIFDRWHLKEGQDKFDFMERMVKDPQVKKVLVFSDRVYAEKANARQGGVGTESQIISREVYENVGQKKFIPIVCERDGTGEPCLPVFLKSRIYFDFSTPDKEHDEYEKLVRAIFDKPLYKRPTLGKPPEYILEPEKPYVWSTPLLQAFKAAASRDAHSCRGHAIAFLQAYAERLEEFRIAPEIGKEFDDHILGSVDSFLPFRNDFVDFANTLALYAKDGELFEQMADVFERCLGYKHPPLNINTPWSVACFDNFAFILYELLLYVIALLLKTRRLADVSTFTDRLYVVPENAQPSGGLTHFEAFLCSCDSFMQRNRRLQLNRLSPEADLLKQRANLKYVTFSDLMQADAVLFLKSILDESIREPWCPYSFAYSHYMTTFPLFAKAAQKKEFNGLKAMLQVSDKEELLRRFAAGMQRHKSHSMTLIGHFTERLDFRLLFGLQKLDTV